MGTIARGSKAGGGTNFNTGQTIDPAEVNTDFNTIVTEINGALDDGNVETGTIPGSKTLRFTERSNPSAPSSNDLLLYAKDSGGITKPYTIDASSNVLAVGYERIAGTGTEVALIPGVVDVDTTVVGTNADTNEKVLHSHTIGANTLTVESAAIQLVANGTVAANGNNKTIRVRINGVAGTVLVDSGTIATNDAFWDIDLWCVYSSSSTLDIHGVLRVGAAGGATGAVSVHRMPYVIASGLTLTSAITLDITGLNGTASANDITCRFSRSIFWPAA